MSKIPQISFNYLGSLKGQDSIQANVDTALLQFSITDGNADLGNPQTGTQYDIYINDMRYDTGYQGWFFPTIDQSIENAKNGIQGTCEFLFIPSILSARTDDSIHINYADTVYFKVYIVDRAGNYSNIITTSRLRLMHL